MTCPIPTLKVNGCCPGSLVLNKIQRLCQQCLITKYGNKPDMNIHHPLSLVCYKNMAILRVNCIKTLVRLPSPPKFSWWIAVYKTSTMYGDLVVDLKLSSITCSHDCLVKTSLKLDFFR